MKILKDDTVIVINGKYASKTGKVLKVLPDEKKLIVEGVNLLKRHTKPSQKNPQGGILEKEGTIHISKVMYYSTKFNVATRIGYKFLDDGAKVRYCKNPECQGEIIN